MSDERKPQSQESKELLAHDVDARVRRYRRRGDVIGVVGVLSLGLVLFAPESLQLVLGLLGGVLLLLSWRMRVALRSVREIRAATEAAGRADHVELERRLRAQLESARGANTLSVLELLGNSLWKRGEVRALAEVFRAHVRPSDAGDTGPFGEWYAKAHAYLLLADACTGDASAIEARAQQIEGGNTPDSRAAVRLALARAVAAIRMGDPAAASRALEGFEHKSLDASAEDRALGRALRAMAGRTNHVGEAYRGTTTAGSGGAMRAWVEKVFAPAAAFVDEPPMLQRDDPSWNRAPTAAPSFAKPTREGKRPLLAVQSWTLFGGWVVLVVSLFTLSTATSDFAFVGMILALLSWMAGIGIAVVRRVQARRNTRSIRAGAALRLRAQFDEMESVLPTSARDPLASATALLLQTHVEMSRGSIEAALACVDRAIGRLAWLKERARETLPWANAVLMRPSLLAMLGREQEAESALAFASMAVIEANNGRGLRFSVRLWTALALGRREEALEIARTFDLRTPIDGRTELARDALLALNDPAARLRVRDRVEAWPQVRVVFDKVCPWLAEAWQPEAPTGVRIEATQDEISQPDRDESRSVADDGAAQGRGGSTP